jgi:hypothetical protein
MSGEIEFAVAGSAKIASRVATDTLLRKLHGSALRSKSYMTALASAVCCF